MDVVFGVFLVGWICFPAFALIVWVLAVIRHRARSKGRLGFVGAWSSLWRLMLTGEATPTASIKPDTAPDTEAPPDEKSSAKVRSQVVSFSYVDAKGDRTTRKVRVDRVGEWHFSGYCQKRRALRTFRYDRVSGRVTLQETGEIVEPSELRTTLLND